MASEQTKAECEKKLKELGGLVTKFIIRRTNDLLSKYRKLFCFFSFPRFDIYAYHRASASQIRASRVLWTIRIPACFVSIVYCVTRD